MGSSPIVSTAPHLTAEAQVRALAPANQGAPAASAVATTVATGGEVGTVLDSQPLTSGRIADRCGTVVASRWYERGAMQPRRWSTDSAPPGRQIVPESSSRPGEIIATCVGRGSIAPCPGNLVLS